MNKNINDITNKQLSWIIQNYLSNEDYYLLKYLFDLLISENIKSKDITLQYLMILDFYQIF